MNIIDTFKIGDIVQVSLLYQVNGVSTTDLALTFKIISAGAEVVASTPLQESVTVPGLYLYEWNTAGLDAGVYYVYFYEGDKLLGYDQYDISKFLNDQATGVWSTQFADNNEPGSFGETLQRIRNIEEGNWRIIGTQMVFYNLDDQEMFRFNLFDKDDAPSYKDVFRRVKA